MPIIAPIPQDECQKMRKLIHKTRDKNYSRRLTALLMLNEGLTVTYVAKTLHAARSSVNRWVEWFTLYGLEGLKSLPAGDLLSGISPLSITYCFSYYSNPPKS